MLHFRQYFHRFTAPWSIMRSECQTVDVLWWATTSVKKAAWFEIASHLQILVWHTIFTFGTNKYCLPISTIHRLTINNKIMDSCSTNVTDEHNGFRESIDFHQDEGNLWEMSELRRDRPESDIRSRNWTSFLQGDNHCFQKSDFHWKIKVSLFFFCQLPFGFFTFSQQIVMLCTVLIDNGGYNNLAGNGSEHERI